MMGEEVRADAPLEVRMMAKTLARVYLTNLIIFVKRDYHQTSAQTYVCRGSPLISTTLPGSEIGPPKLNLLGLHLVFTARRF